MLACLKRLGTVRVCLLVLLAEACALAPALGGPDRPREIAGGPLLVYYAADAPIAAFDPYKLLVLDDLHHPPLQPLSHRGKTLLGYLSLGEVSRDKPGFAQVESEGLLLVENPHWPGSFMVDLRDERWAQRVIEVLIPGVLQQGFDGLFLDTLDNAAYLESLDPKRYRGMTRAAVRLVQTIRYHYPTIPLMQNRASELLEEVDGSIDYWLGESLLADQNPSTGEYSLATKDEYLKSLEPIRAAMSRRPGLKVYTLDYWKLEDLEGIAEIYRRQREQGFEPYVSTLALDQIVREPSP